MNKTQKNGNNDMVSSDKVKGRFFHSRQKKKFPTTEFEILGNTSNNTFTNFIYQAIQDNFLLAKKEKTIIVDEKKSILNNVINKNVKFKSPFTEIIDIPSMKFYNSKMTFNEYQGDVVLSSKKCCSSSKVCQIY